MPEPDKDNVYIVSSLVLAALKGTHDDVVTPATSHKDCVRNGKGQIVGVPGFVKQYTKNNVMKSFDEYCKSLVLSKYKLPIQEARTFEEFLDLNNLTETTVSDEAIKFFYDYNINERFDRCVDEYSGNLLEMLSVQSNDKIKEMLLSNIKSIYTITPESDSKFGALKLTLVNGQQSLCSFGESEKDNSLKDTPEANKFKEILDFCGYYITLIDVNMGQYTIYIEPKMTEDDFDEIRKLGGCVWHVTSRSLKMTIKRTGLRPKAGKVRDEGGYRYFPERIYFLKNSKDIKSEIKEIAKAKSLSRYIIVKVDLKEHKFPLYKDTAYDTDGKVYTYTAIPPSMITIYDDVENI